MKISAQAALVSLDLLTVIEKMNNYAEMRLRNLSAKQLAGREPRDFVADVIVKVLDGTRDWVNTEETNMEAFLFGCLKSECNHWRSKSIREDVVLVSIIDDLDTDELFKGNTIKYTRHQRFLSSKELITK